MWWNCILVLNYVIIDISANGWNCMNINDIDAVVNVKDDNPFDDCRVYYT